MSFMGRSLRQLRHHPRDWLLGQREDATQVLRVSVAAAISWLVAEQLLPDATPVLGPLTAILCVQATVYRSLTTAVQRAAGVIVGVLLAFIVAHWLGLHWWSVGLVTAAGLMIGAVLRLRSASAEIAISALLVLAVGSGAQFAAVGRVLETLLGAVVGVATNIILAPSVYVRSADRELADLAVESSDLLAAIAAGLRAGWRPEDAREWLTRARRQSDEVHGARETLLRAEESLRYNPRRYRAPASLDHLRSGWDSLEHASAQVRSIARALLDAADPAAESGPRRAGREAYARCLDGAADAMRAFGAAVSDPLAPATPSRVEALRQAITAARSAYRDATGAMSVDPQAEPATWRVNGTLLNAVGNLAREMDPDDGPHGHAFRPEASPPLLDALRPPAEAALRPVRRLGIGETLRRAGRPRR